MAGSDLQAGVEVTLEEAATGVTKQVELERTAECDACGGTGAEGGRMKNCDACGGTGHVVQGRGAFIIQSTCRACGGQGRIPETRCGKCAGHGLVAQRRKIEVKIPPGVYSGLRLRVTGEGNAGLHGGPAGDLYVLLDVAPHELFHREEGDLHCQLAVSYSTACLGGEAEIPGLGGSSYPVEVPAGTQPGDVIRVPHAGVRRIDGSGIGDLLVHVTIQVPTKVDKSQRKALQDLDAALPQPTEVQPLSRGKSRERAQRRRRGGSLFDRIRDALDGEP